MAKTKLKKFAELNSFSNVIQPQCQHPVTDHFLKGRWKEVFFRNNFPIVLEVGCGKGEYTLGLARTHPGVNFVGIDIKGDRLWRGARESLDEALFNVAFLRIQAERINAFFAPGEVSGIWLTFPEPQPRESRSRKRLTSPHFLKRYSQCLAPGSPIHLKTDSTPLYDYTLEVIESEGHHLLEQTRDLYHAETKLDPWITNIQTYYESKFLAEGLPIHYLKFALHED